MKKFIAILLMAIMATTLCACAGGGVNTVTNTKEPVQSTSTNKEENSLSELQAKIKELEAEITALKEKTKALEEENSALKEELEKLEKENTELKKQLEENKVEENKTGVYKLEEAYKNGLLTKDDLRHITYFKSGEVYEGRQFLDEDNCIIEESHKVDFTPTMNTPVIREAIKQRIKEVYYEHNREKLEALNKSIEDIAVSGYLGEYNGVCVAYIAYDDYMIDYDWIHHDFIGGIRFVDTGLDGYLRVIKLGRF